MKNKKQSDFYKKLKANPGNFQTRDGKEISIKELDPDFGVKWLGFGEYPLRVAIEYPNHSSVVSYTSEGKFKDCSKPMITGKDRTEMINHISPLDLIEKP